jgi:hypothetical protein
MSQLAAFSSMETFCFKGRKVEPQAKDKSGIPEQAPPNSITPSELLLKKQ